MADSTGEQLEDYQPRSPEVTRVGDGWIEAWLGNRAPSPGTALRIDGPDDHTVIGRTLDHRGATVVGAQLLHTPDWLEQGLPVSVDDRSAHLPAPDSDTLDLREASFVPASNDPGQSLPFELPDIPFTAYDTRRPAVRTGHTGVDLLAPVQTGGCTLILDNGPAAAGSLLVDAIYDAMASDASDDSLIPLELITPDTWRWWHPSADEPVEHWHAVHTGGSRHLHWIGFRAAASWIASRRSDAHPTLFAADLPRLQPNGTRPPQNEDDPRPPVSVGSVLNRLTDAMTSTDDARVSCILRLPLRDSAQGANAVIETLPLGDVDTTIFIDEAGNFDPMRSSSDAQLPDDEQWQTRRDRAFRALQTLRGLEDQKAIHGEDSMTDRQREAETLIDGLARPLGG